MPSPTLDQITLIVRHCGERTTEACAQLLAQFAPGNRVHRVSARPFQEVLRQSLELGLAQGRPWTLCIDADVLILPDLAGFLAAVDSFPDGFFEAQALVLDKLIPARRPAGNHLYRTELIARALRELPRGDSLRPENDMIRAMAAKGYPAHQSAQLIGLHDFAQAHRDIYLKAFLHAHKHGFLVPLLRPFWASLSRTDDDFRVALKALEDVQARGAIQQISRDFGAEWIDGVLDAMRLAPQAPLADLSPTELAAMLQASTAQPDRAVQAMVDEIQARIDAVIFPSETSAPGVAGILSTFMRSLRNACHKNR